MNTLFLYGPPAAGKDAVTAALGALDRRYLLYERLKVGGGRTKGYRIVGRRQVEQLRKDGLLLWENCRYGALYAVERNSLLRMLPERIPVVHLGQPEAIDAITAALPGLHGICVYLWCPRAVAAERLASRGTGDVDERLAVWDKTAPLACADLFINTAAISVAQAARAIHRVVVNA